VTILKNWPALLGCDRVEEVNEKAVAAREGRGMGDRRNFSRRDKVGGLLIDALYSVAYLEKGVILTATKI
jgi:hypothetical protein